MPRTSPHNRLLLQTTRQANRPPCRLNVPNPPRNFHRLRCFHLHFLRRRFLRTKSRHSRTVSGYVGCPVNTPATSTQRVHRVQLSTLHRSTDFTTKPDGCEYAIRHPDHHRTSPPNPSGIHHYAPGPPRSLTASLGREIEKFDQLCDALESRLVRVSCVTTNGDSYNEDVATSDCGTTTRSQTRTGTTPSRPRLPTPVQTNFPGGWGNNYAGIPTAATFFYPGSISIGWPSTIRRRSFVTPETFIPSQA